MGFPGLFGGLSIQIQIIVIKNISLFNTLTLSESRKSPMLYSLKLTNVISQKWKNHFGTKSYILGSIQAQKKYSS